MIKTEKEYLETKNKIEQGWKMLDSQEEKMIQSGMTTDQIQLANSPTKTLITQLQEEVSEYENFKRGNFYSIENFMGIGKLIIAFRLFKNIEVAQLALKLGISESQLLRDENNEYHGASIEKIEQVMAALDMKISTKVKSLF